MLPHSRAVWTGIFAGVVALDWWCDRGDPDGDTITEMVRDWWAVETPLGRAAFTVCLAVGAHLVQGHICKATA